MVIAVGYFTGNDMQNLDNDPNTINAMWILTALLDGSCSNNDNMCPEINSNKNFTLAGIITLIASGFQYMLYRVIHKDVVAVPPNFRQRFY